MARLIRTELPMVKTFALFLFFLSFASIAEEAPLKVVALFNGAAMVEFGGKQKLYRKGDKISDEVQLIEADTRSATFRINGKSVSIPLNQQVGFLKSQKVDTKPASNTGQQSFQILRSLNGMYETPGFINGYSVQFLVDTGATTIAMNEKVATRLGIPYRVVGIKSAASTASGVVRTWIVNLKKVKVGTIELSNVRGSVIQGAGPNEVLLGQSFLNQLKVETEGRLLRLTKKY